MDRAEAPDTLKATLDSEHLHDNSQRTYRSRALLGACAYNSTGRK